MFNESRLLETIRQQREQIEELEETVRQFRGMDITSDPLPPGMPDLSCSLETIVRCLLARPDGASRERLYTVLYQHGEGRQLRTVEVFVSKLRKKLVGTEYRIITTRGPIYQLVKPEVSAVPVNRVSQQSFVANSREPSHGSDENTVPVSG